MKLLEKTPTGYKFETSNGATWTRTKLVWAAKSVEIHGWEASRNLYLIDEADLEFFPDATHYIELTSSRAQDDPMFCAVPCRIKPGTKNILQTFDHDNSIDKQVRIKHHFNWS